MTIARSNLVDPEVALFYHLASRCVRSSWLCGTDPQTGIDYSHRKQWLVERMLHLGQYYSVDVHAYAVMSNHFHQVVYYDPLAAQSWSDEEVVRRWMAAHPLRGKDANTTQRIAQRCEALLQQPERIASYREQLGSLSCYMQHLKQPIAWRANQEDQCRGHFFESRFYSGALLSEEAALAAMAYVDLNPVRAEIALSIEHCANTSIATRLQALENNPQRLEAALAPLVSGLESQACKDLPNQTPGEQNSEPSKPATRYFELTLGEYIERLNAVVFAELHNTPQEQNTRDWITRVAANRKRQRAFGSAHQLRQWLGKRQMRPLELASR